MNISQALAAIETTGSTIDLLELLAGADPDEVIRQLGKALMAEEPGATLTIVGRLEIAESSARKQRHQLRKQTRAGQLGMLGARYKGLEIAERTAAELHTRLKREIGRFLASLPEDPGGREVEVEEGEPSTQPRREARRDLGLDKDDARAFVELAAVPDEAFDRFVDQVRTGDKRPPTRVAGLVRAISRGSWSSDECYTPREWPDAARRMLGGRLSFDAASNLAAQAGLVRAEAWCSLDDHCPEIGPREVNLAGPLSISTEDFERARSCWVGCNGLVDENGDAREWPDGWWSNPPFNAEAVRAFHARFEAERIKGHRGVVLVNADTSKGSQLELLRHCLAAWPIGRISFWLPTGEQLRGNRAAQVLFGINIEPEVWRRELEGLAVPTRPWGAGQ